MNIRLFVLLSSLAFLLSITSGQASAQAEDDFGIATRAPRSYALVIGVSDYVGGGRVGQQTRLGPFRDLPNACRDAGAIGAQLKLAGWQQEDDPERTELRVVCNPDLNALKAEMSVLRRRIEYAMGHKPESGSSDVVFLLYFTGHGVEIDGYDFLFGKQAAPDLDAAAQISVRPGPPGDPFPDTAYDLYRDFYSKFGDVDVPVIVILDACRENPIPGILAEKILAGGHPVPTVGIPSALAYEANGVHRVFATARGHPSYDGPAGSHSFFAQSLLTRIKADADLWKTMASVRQDVLTRTQAIYGVPKRQVPDIDIGATPVCFYRCRADPTHRDSDVTLPITNGPGVPPSTRSFETSFLGRAPVRLTRAVWTQDSVMPAERPSSPTPRRTSRPDRLILYSRPETAPGDPASATALDFFFCKGTDPGVEARYANALEAGSALAAFAKTLDAQGVASGISRVTVRSWSEVTNAGLGNRHTHNAGVIDDRVEQGLLDKINSLQRLQFTTTIKGPRYRPTPNYVGLFVCALTQPGDPPNATSASNVYLHVAPGAVTGTALPWSQVIAAVPGASAEPVEAVDARPDLTTVKYYFMEDRDRAFALARALDARRLGGKGQARQQNVTTIVTPLTGQSRLPNRGVIEVWVGKLDELR